MIKLRYLSTRVSPEYLYSKLITLYLPSIVIVSVTCRVACAVAILFYFDFKSLPHPLFNFSVRQPRDFKSVKSLTPTLYPNPKHSLTNTNSNTNIILRSSTLMELSAGTTSPAYKQPRKATKAGVKKNSGTGNSIQLSVTFEASTWPCGISRRINTKTRDD